MSQVIAVGDRVMFDDVEHHVSAISGTTVRLISTSSGQVSAVSLLHLVSSDGFTVLEGRAAERRPTRLGGQSLDDLTEAQAGLARFWQSHVIEVQTGLPPTASENAVPRPEYDPSLPIADRDAAKAAELTAAGKPTTARTVKRMRLRYQSGGVRALVDGRTTVTGARFGRNDERVVAAVEEALTAETNRSTGTRDRLRHRVEMILANRYGDGVVVLPSKATFNRLVAELSEGRHSFGSAKTRRSAANRPAGAFTVTWASRPGEHVQIDTTPLDVLAVFDDGVARRVELTAVVDVATRTICAGLLRPVGTKAVDASLLLARVLVPEQLRPGWDPLLAMSESSLPHRSLADIDERMRHAAAKPVIVPETIGCDRGKVFLSETFLRSCEHLAISVLPSHPRTPTDNSVVERTFQSINTLFCQYVSGYVGRDVAWRGTHVEAEAVWSLAQLQELFDEWVLHWQRRPHDGLRSPDSRTVVSPNEMYAMLVAAAGYLPLMLTGDDYVELLPADWRTINDYGIRFDNRTYDSPDLNPYRREPSGVTAHDHRWEIRYDPYDLRQIYVRDHRAGGWIRARWTHLPMVSAPFADYTWRHARSIAQTAQTSEPMETAAARALSKLLARAGDGLESGEPRGQPAADRKVAARTRAAHSELELVDLRELPLDEDDFEEEADAGELGTVIPFGVFDAEAEAERWI